MYYPENDACYPAYRKGPCENGQMISLTPEDRIVPSCIANPCQKDGEVHVQGTCYTLETQGPCPGIYPNLFVLGVNPKTLELDCLPLSIDFGPRFAKDEEETQTQFDAKSMDFCARGSKRAIQGHC